MPRSQSSHCEQPRPRASPREVPQLTAGCGSGALYRAGTGQHAGGASIPAGLSPRCARWVCEGLIWEDVLIIKLLFSFFFFFPSGDDLITAWSPWQPRLQKTPPMGTRLRERTGAGSARLPHGGMEPGCGPARCDGHPRHRGPLPAPSACGTAVPESSTPVTIPFPQLACVPCTGAARGMPAALAPVGRSSAGLPSTCGRAAVCTQLRPGGAGGPRSPTPPERCSRLHSCCERCPVCGTPSSSHAPTSLLPSPPLAH